MVRREAKIVHGGRLILPAEVRREMALKDGDTVILELDDGELTVISPRVALGKFREELRRYVPEGVSLADELVAERRAEAARE